MMLKLTHIRQLKLGLAHTKHSVNAGSSFYVIVQQLEMGSLLCPSCDPLLGPGNTKVTKTAPVPVLKEQTLSLQINIWLQA